MGPTLRRHCSPAEAEQWHQHRRCLGPVGRPSAGYLDERQHHSHAARCVCRPHTQTRHTPLTIELAKPAVPLLWHHIEQLESAIRYGRRSSSV